LQGLGLGVLALAFFISTQEFPEFGKIIRVVDSVLMWFFLLSAFVVTLIVGWRASVKLNLAIFAFGLGLILLTAMTTNHLFGTSLLDTLVFRSWGAQHATVGYGVMLGALTAFF
jgi:hypothetical protein